MPINFTVVPVEDAEGGASSAAAAGGTKADISAPAVVVGEDGDRFQGPDSGTQDSGTICATVGLVLSGITTKKVDQFSDNRLDPCVGSLSPSHTDARAHTLMTF